MLESLITGFLANAIFGCISGSLGCDIGLPLFGSLLVDHALLLMLI